MTSEKDQASGAEKNAAPSAGNLAEELARMQAEPLLPIEKKLILYSLLLGVGLLGLLAWISLTFFKA